MIAKIHKAESLLAALDYNLRKVDKGHVYLLYGSGISFNPEKLTEPCRDEIINEFSNHLEILNKRGRTKKPIVHLSLNPSPDDDVSDTTYTYIAEDYLAEMGFEGQPFVVFKHEDIGRHHIHILTTNVRADGTKIDERFSHRRSVRACEKLEKQYGLIPAKFSKRKDMQAGKNTLKKISLQNYVFDIKKGDSSAQIRQIVREVNQNYHFESDGEYRALLRLFGVEADFKDARVKAKQGIVFYGLNSEGTRITKPLRSYLIEKGLLKKIENKFVKSKRILTNPQIKAAIKQKLDFVKTANSKVDFYEKLSEQNMDVFFRRNDDGRIYGATIIDHDYGVVINGSKLGKAYSANVFNDLLNRFEKGNLEKRYEAAGEEQYFPQYREYIPGDGGLTFVGNTGAGFGHYARVGDDEKLSENDKLNIEIKKRNKKKSSI